MTATDYAERVMAGRHPRAQGGGNPFLANWRNTMPRFRTHPVGLGATVGLVLALLTAAAAPASAQKIDGGTFHEEDTFVVEDFCDVSGLDVEGHVTVDGRFLVRLQGPDSIVYFMDNTRTVIEWTNLATGQHATDISRMTTSKDLSITVNDDGTITLIVLLTGSGQLYGDDGRLIAKGDGQIRLRDVIDYNGTLSDPSDDTEVSSELFFGSTGTNDDYCAAILDDWGVTP
jgi:hypothetical protein